MRVLNSSTTRAGKTCWSRKFVIQAPFCIFWCCHCHCCCRVCCCCCCLAAQKSKISDFNKFWELIKAAVSDIRAKERERERQRECVCVCVCVCACLRVHMSVWEWDRKREILLKFKLPIRSCSPNWKLSSEISIGCGWLDKKSWSTNWSNWTKIGRSIFWSI